MEPIRVLHEDAVMEAGGIETFIMNVYRHIDRSKVQFDFMVHRPYEAFHDKEILELGGKIYRTPEFNPIPHKYKAFKEGIKKVFIEHPEYKVLHAHADLKGWPIKFAAECGVPTRIGHSHSAKTSVNLKYFFFRYEHLWIKKYCTDMFMCSTPAGNWTFGKKAVAANKTQFIKNGVETSLFQFNDSVRTDVRKELGLGNKIVFGHIGRLSQAKNHKFLLEVFNEIHKKNPNTVLLIVGDGELNDQCRAYASQFSFGDSVKFLGVRRDVPRILQAMDLFIFPSLWEGLPLTVVEAQTSGLPVLMSDVITPEVIITNGLKTCSLSESADKWADTALNLAKNHKRYDCRQEVIDAGFDIQSTVDFLQEFYIQRTMEALRTDK